MMTQTTKRIGVITMVLFVVTAAVFGYTLHAIDQQGKVLLYKSQLVANQLVQEQTYATLDKLMRSSAGERAELTTYILTESETITFLSTIEKTATHEGVQLKTNNLHVTKGKSFDTLVASFTLSGTKSSVDQMVRVLETLPYASSLNSVALQTDKDGNTTGQVELAVTLQHHDQ